MGLSFMCGVPRLLVGKIRIRPCYRRPVRRSIRWRDVRLSATRCSRRRLTRIESKWPFDACRHGANRPELEEGDSWDRMSIAVRTRHTHFPLSFVGSDLPHYKRTMRQDYDPPGQDPTLTKGEACRTEVNAAERDSA